jgi:hypothetical protein
MAGGAFMPGPGPWCHFLSVAWEQCVRHCLQNNSEKMMGWIMPRRMWSATVFRCLTWSLIVMNFSAAWAPWRLRVGFAWVSNNLKIWSWERSRYQSAPCGNNGKLIALEVPSFTHWQDAAAWLSSAGRAATPAGSESAWGSVSEPDSEITQAEQR